MSRDPRTLAKRKSVAQFGDFRNVKPRKELGIPGESRRVGRLQKSAGIFSAEPGYGALPLMVNDVFSCSNGVVCSMNFTAPLA